MKSTKITAVILAGFLLAAGCKKFGGPVIEQGSKVAFNYTLTVDGKTADSSQGRGPLSFVVGQNMIIPGLEEQMLGMKKGEKKHVSVTPDKGYGMRDEKAVQKVPKAAFKGQQQELKAGDKVSGQFSGQPFIAEVKEVGNDFVILDFNHPMAGKNLDFDIEVVSVENPAAK